MKISYSSKIPICHIVLKGTIAASDIHLLEDTIAEASATGAREIWLDCTDLEEISAEALGYLTLREHRLQEKGINLALIQVSHKILNLFQKVQLDVTLPVYATKEEACRAYREK